MFIALCYPYYIVFQVISQHIVFLFLSMARKNAETIKILSLGIIVENLVTQLVNVLDVTLKSFNQIESSRSRKNIILVHTYFRTGELVEFKLPNFRLYSSATSALFVIIRNHVMVYPMGLQKIVVGYFLYPVMIRCWRISLYLENRQV